jgi:hypothetical protein
MIDLLKLGKLLALLGVTVSPITVNSVEELPENAKDGMIAIVEG